MAPRAVMPWTWARALRDCGPQSRDFVCAMLILRTWMDDTGFAYPSNRTWARAARMSVNTLRKHINSAVAAGWLAIETETRATGGKRWRISLYRCAVPSDIDLSETDEMLANSLLAQVGDIEEAVSLKADTPSPPSCVIHADTASPVAIIAGAGSKELRKPEAVSNKARKLCQKNPKLYQTDPQAVSPRVIRKFSEVLEVVNKDSEGAARSRSTSTSGILERRHETRSPCNAASIAKAKKLIASSPDLKDFEVAKIAHVSVADVQAARRAASTVF